MIVNFKEIKEIKAEQAAKYALIRTDGGLNYSSIIMHAQGYKSQTSQQIRMSKQYSPWPKNHLYHIDAQLR